jgi:hypothetical protein
MASLAAAPAAGNVPVMGPAGGNGNGNGQVAGRNSPPHEQSVVSYSKYSLNVHKSLTV